MDTSASHSYVSLTLTEIQKRFQELMEEDELELTLEEPELKSANVRDSFNPYDHST